MIVGILQTGRVPPALQDRFGDYDAIFARFLGDGPLTFETYLVLDGEFPESPMACDGWLITGSRHGAYENHVWIPPLEKFLKNAVKLSRPVVGICFGHQILAQALGGKVEKFSGGWSIGTEHYEMQGFAEGIDLIAWHQDQVVELPQGARVVASSPFCKYAALSYGQTAFTLQPHPEFDPAYAAALIEARKDLLPADVMRRGQASLNKPTGSPAMADYINAFFAQHSAGA